MTKKKHTSTEEINLLNKFELPQLISQLPMGIH